MHEPFPATAISAKNALTASAETPCAATSRASVLRKACREHALPPLPRGTAGFAFTAALFLAGIAVCFGARVPLQTAIDGFSFNVLVILVSMDLFTSMLAGSGVMEAAALRLARLSHGSQTALLVMIAVMMFLVSACLNNITAMLVVLPCIFVLLQGIAPDRRYLGAFFAVLLGMSNTGGASSAIGDLPAVLIMSTGVVSFSQYTFAAFPLMALTSALLVGFWCFILRRVPQDRGASSFAIGILGAQYRFVRVDMRAAVPLFAILAAMIVCWCVVPQNVVPPEIIALTGCLVATVAYRLAGNRVSQVVDLSSVLTISGFLFLASAVASTGALEELVAALAVAVPDQKLFLALMLVATSLIAGLVGAGPAAAACLPIVSSLATTTFAASSTLVMVAYGAAICAGSSLFLFSATAGYVLSGKIDGAALNDSTGARFTWGVRTWCF